MSGSWRKATLASVVDIISGGTPKTTVREYWNGDIPWLSVSDFNTGYRYVSFAAKSITNLGVSESATTVLDRGDIVISARGTVGVVAQLGRPMAFNQSCYGIRGKREIADTNFIYYLLRYVVPELKRVTHGAVFDTITRETFETIEIALPSLPEQRAIAHILGTLDDKIEINRQMNETLEAMARALFKSWFIDFDPVRAKADGRDPALPADIAALFPDSFEDSGLGEIPKGWRVSSIGSAADVIDCLHSKKPERRTTGLPLLQLANIRDDGLIDMQDEYLISDHDYWEWVSRIEASPGDCVITNVGRVGAVAQMACGKKAALGRNMTAVRCKPSFPFPTVLIECLHSEAMRDEIARKTDVGTILDALNVRNIPDLRFVGASDEVLQCFESKVRPLRAEMEQHLVESRTLASLRDTLLPRLISGKIDVSKLNLKEDK